MSGKNKISRRDILKGLAVVPIAGYFGYSFLRKKNIEEKAIKERQKLLSELGFEYQPEQSLESSLVPKGKGDHVRLGIIGIGNRGKSILKTLGYANKDWIKNHTDNAGKPDKTLQDFLEHDDLNISIAAVCDVFDLHLQEGIEISEYNRKENSYSNAPAKGYKDYRRLLEDKNVDAVIIATPDFWHGRMSVDAIKAGKHVYCEKCMTNNEKETVELYDVVKAGKQVLQVGHQYLQNDCFLRAKQLIQNNKVGKITLIDISSNRNSSDSAWVRHLDKEGKPKPGDPHTIDWDLYLGTAPRVPFDLKRYYNWSLYWDYSTGISGQLLSHEFDVANQLMGLGIPDSVVADGGIFFYKKDRETPDAFNVICNFPGKDINFLFSSSLSSNRNRGRLFLGHDGSIEIDNNLKVFIDHESEQYAKYIRKKDINPEKVFYEYIQGIGEVDASTSPTEQYYASRGLTYTLRNGKKADVSFLHLREWLACIRFGGTPSCDIEKGFEVTMACHMATRAYLEKRRVCWDPDKRRIV